MAVFDTDWWRSTLERWGLSGLVEELRAVARYSLGLEGPGGPPVAATSELPSNPVAAPSQVTEAHEQPPASPVSTETPETSESTVSPEPKKARASRSTSAEDVSPARNARARRRAAETPESPEAPVAESASEAPVKKKRRKQARAARRAPAAEAAAAESAPASTEPAASAEAEPAPKKARSRKASGSRPAKKKAVAKDSARKSSAESAGSSEAVRYLLEALRSHPRQEALVAAGRQKDQLLRSLIPFFLVQGAGVEVTSGTISRFWKELGVTYAAPNAAKALRLHAGHVRAGKKGKAITPKGQRYVEEALEKPASAASA